MRRQIPGLHSVQQDPEANLDGLFLVRVERASYRWHRQKSFLEIRFIVLEPASSASRSFSGRLHRPRALETQLVPSRLRLRHRAPKPRPSGRKISG
jgi:hypothetical protein